MNRIESTVDQAILVPLAALVMTVSLGVIGGREAANKTKECKGKECVEDVPWVQSDSVVDAQRDTFSDFSLKTNHSKKER